MCCVADVSSRGVALLLLLLLLVARSGAAGRRRLPVNDVGTRHKKRRQGEIYGACIRAAQLSCWVVCRDNAFCEKESGTLLL